MAFHVPIQKFHQAQKVFFQKVAQQMFCLLKSDLTEYVQIQNLYSLDVSNQKLTAIRFLEFD
jgi:hypothetical protein